MQKIVSISVLLTFLFFMSGCKGGPTTPAPSVQFITVTSTSTMLYIGATETFTATVTMSDGTIKAVTSGTWSSSNTSIATVNNLGLVTIVGSGSVIISVTYQGKTGSKSIRGLPNYQGSWRGGSYTITSCTATGDFLTAAFCSSFQVGTVGPIELVLTQTQDVVTGTIYLGSLSAAVNGPVATNGLLVLTGKITWAPFTIDVATSFQSTTPGQITGTFNMFFLATGLSGNGQTTCVITSLNRTTTIAIELPSAELRVKTRTLEDLRHALLIR